MEEKTRFGTFRDYGPSIVYAGKMQMIAGEASLEYHGDIFMLRISTWDCDGNVTGTQYHATTGIEMIYPCTDEECKRAAHRNQTPLERMETFDKIYNDFKGKTNAP